MPETENKISVITVVFNDVKHIKETINSFLSQTWVPKEYIIIDGGSTDGTREIIEKYKDNLAFFCSEKDNGIYDAMNKGIKKATGDWICFLNSGDFFVANDSLEKAVNTIDTTNVDIIYGNSLEINKFYKNSIYSTEDTKKLEYFPIYRHGSSLVKAAVQKNHLFNLSRKDLKYALDIEMIHRLFREGYTFKKADVFIEAFNKEGISDNPYRNIYYNYKVSADNQFNLFKFVLMIKLALIELIKKSYMYLWLKSFFMEFITNDILQHIPFWCCRKFYLKMTGTKIGHGSFIMKKNYLINSNRLSIGNFSHINRDCIIDSRGYITIGNNVSISHRVNIMSGSHEVNSPNMIGIFKKIVIEDYVWIGVNSTILQGVTLGEGAVVCAGAVVTKNVKPYDIVAGIPAKTIGHRNNNLDYHCHWNVPLT